MNLPPYRRPKGLPFTPPPQISRLPMSLLRSALVTRRPAEVQEGIVEYRERMDEEREPPMLMPQRAMFQQWKSDLQTDGRNRPAHKDWSRSVESITGAMRASGVPNSTVHRVQPPPVTFEMADAARRYGGEFSEPPQDLEPPQIVTRDVPAHGRPLFPPPEAFARTMQVVGQRGEVQRRNNAQRAMYEAQVVRQRARQMIVDSDE